MRQDWVEFKKDDGKMVSLRPEYIVSIIEKDDCVWLGYDEKPFVDGQQSLASFYRIAEPYEQVKQKIMDAEKCDLGNVVVERFTKDEYELLLNAVGFFKAACDDTKENIEFLKRIEPLVELENKLNEILKEME